MNSEQTLTLQTERMQAHIDNGIGWMVFNNPARHNALSLEMWEGIGDILTKQGCHCTVCKDGFEAVTELERLLSLKQPAVSQLLTRLRADDLVSTRREGKAIYYSIADPAVREIIQTLYRLYCEPTGLCRETS